MTIFNAMGVAGTGVNVYRHWLDAISDNIANLDTATPTNGDAFRARYVRAQSVSTGGAEVAGAAFGSAEGRMVYEPTSPIADAQGYVRYPDVDLGDQMAQLMMAQRGYQANLAVMGRARDSYEAALQLGRGA